MWVSKSAWQHSLEVHSVSHTVSNYSYSASRGFFFRCESISRFCRVIFSCDEQLKKWQCHSVRSFVCPFLPFSLWRRPFIPLSVWPSVPLSHCPLSLCPPVPLSLCPSVPLSLCPSVPLSPVPLSPCVPCVPSCLSDLSDLSDFSNLSDLSDLSDLTHRSFPSRRRACLKNEHCEQLNLKM